MAGLTTKTTVSSLRRYRQRVREESLGSAMAWQVPHEVAVPLVCPVLDPQARQPRSGATLRDAEHVQDGQKVENVQEQISVLARPETFFDALARTRRQGERSEALRQMGE